jgi:saccharopine dehydrogenase-like NADP-dependent oxidoreductase
MTAHKIVVVGAGRAGLSIARMLDADERYAPILVDPVEEAVKKASQAGFEVVEGSGTDPKIMERIIEGAAVVIMAAPDFVAETVIRTARSTGCHYLDLSENSALAHDLGEIAKGATGCFVPGCGLAPGYISSVIGDVIRNSGDNPEITVYVGALPAHKTNRLGYGNMWSIDGLITEYTNPCSAIISGAKTELPALSEFETISIDDHTFEAFTTAGSVDSLVERLNGRVGGLVFKTLRYPGHLDYMKFLLDDLGLSKRLSTLKNLLQNGLPITDNDQIVLGITCRFQKPGESYTRRHEHTYFQRVRSIRHNDGHCESALSRITAAHCCSVADVLCGGLVEHSGLLHPEQIDLELLDQSAFYSALRPQSHPQDHSRLSQVL